MQGDFVFPRSAALSDHAHIAQQLERGGDVLQARHVMQRDGLVGQQRGAQLGQGGVLGTGNIDVALQATAAADSEFVHGSGENGTVVATAFDPARSAAAGTPVSG